MIARGQGLEGEEIGVPIKGSTREPCDDSTVLYLDFGDH